jgi:hypothetical protein
MFGRVIITGSASRSKAVVVNFESPAAAKIPRNSLLAFVERDSDHAQSSAHAARASANCGIARKEASDLLPSGAVGSAAAASATPSQGKIGLSCSVNVLGNRMDKTAPHPKQVPLLCCPYWRAESRE